MGVTILNKYEFWSSVCKKAGKKNEQGGADGKGGANSERSAEVKKVGR